MQNGVILLFVSFLVLFGSCTHSNKASMKNDEVVNLDKENSVSLYDMFSKVEIIPMETTDETVMGYPPKKMLVNDGQFYFLAQKAQVICQFDENGRFVKKINYHSSGPQEYSDISDFRFNHFSGDLEILCAWGYINVYDPSGCTFKKRISFDKKDINVVHNFIELSPDRYLLFPAARKGNKMVWYDVAEDRAVAEDYNLPEFLFFNTPYSHTFSPFYMFNDTVHFVQAYNGEVYVADKDGGLKPKYDFDFGEYNFDISTLKEESVEYYVRHSHSIGARYANRFIAYGENSRYYISRFAFRRSLYHLVMNKRDGSVMTFQRLKEKCLCFPVCMDETALYFFASPQELQVAINPEILSDEERKKFDSVLPDDNPVVIKYTFK